MLHYQMSRSALKINKYKISVNRNNTCDDNIQTLNSVIIPIMCQFKLQTVQINIVEKMFSV